LYAHNGSQEGWRREGQGGACLSRTLLRASALLVLCDQRQPHAPLCNVPTRRTCHSRTAVCLCFRCLQAGEGGAVNKEAANAAKALGNTAFSAGNFAEAAEHFSAAIAADPTDHIFFSNRRCVGDARCVAGARPARGGDSTGGSGSLPLSRLEPRAPLARTATRALTPSPHSLPPLATPSACYASLNQFERAVEVRLLPPTHSVH